MSSSVLDDSESIKAVDRNGMIDFCLNSAEALLRSHVVGR